MKHTMTIRIGAAHDDVTILGHRFDRSKLDRKERRAFRELVVERLFPGARRSRRTGK